MVTSVMIPVPFGFLKLHYPKRPNLTPELKKYMDKLNKPQVKDGPPGDNTPCCVQVTHSLNMSGQLVPERFAGQRHQPAEIRIKGIVYYYVLAVDEMESYLNQKYPTGEEVSRDPQRKVRTHQEIKAYLQGRTGILVFRNQGAGKHTELWDGKQILNRGYNEHALFTQPRVLFWDCLP